MFEGVISGSDSLPEEFDDVTSEIKYPPITETTTEKEFLKLTENGWKKWLVVGGLGLVGGCVLFTWALWELTKWL